MKNDTSKNYSPSNFPAKWLRRRARVPDATATAIVELVFGDRIRTLGDRGQTLENAIWEASR